MALPTTNGIFDFENSKIVAPSSLTWDELGAADSAGATRFASWDEWTNWTGVAETPLTWFTDIADLSSTGAFNLTWSFEGVGTPTFTVYTSNTGEFAGEETTKTINVGDTDIDAFEGRYVGVLISVAETSEGIPEITRFEFEASGQRLDLQQFNVNTTDLSGSIGSHVIDPGRVCSKILGVQITAQSDNYVATGYVDNISNDDENYVTSAPPIVASVITKDRSGPQVSFTNLDGTGTNAVFDVTLTVLPEQYMDGNNMAIR